MSKPILDLSEWQPPRTINYDNLSKEICGVIVRVQYGSNYVDKFYKQHIAEFQKRKVPVAVYAWVRGVNNKDMEQEATDFYNRAKAYNPTFWWLDVEEQSMSDMRTGCEKYRAKLKALGAKKVGVYVSNHLYKQFNLDIAKFDGVWIPTYGKNNGKYEGSNPTATKDYDLHQYTSEGRLDGYNGPLDLSRIVRKDLAYFFGGKTTTKPTTKPKPQTGGIKLKTITTTEPNVKLRSSTATKDDKNVIDKLAKGSKVEINDIVMANGIVWGVQPRDDGKKGYIDLGKQYVWVK